MHLASNTATDAKDRPIQNVTIVDCGSLAMDYPFYVDRSAAEL